MVVNEHAPAGRKNGDEASDDTPEKRLALVRVDEQDQKAKKKRDAT